MPNLGSVMALTRNDSCVHEKHGEYDNISIGPGHGLVLNRDRSSTFYEPLAGFVCQLDNIIRGKTTFQFFDINVRRSVL